ncbi:NUDIX domain-containing protein [Thalassotalea sediminis]|uniref:NUDIX domain-containing protein n=1 Tax=Thalassotalea sediminis TaxID=1759089 RepID=UPI0025740F48|nr:NUDIX domain-containing protein [Thalassotalea sediminis]
MKHKVTNSPVLRFGTQDFKVHAKETLYKGFFKMDCYQISYQKFDGNSSAIIQREVFERGDAVVLIPYDPVSDTVVLIEQFRVGAIRCGDSPWLLEFIAGMFEQDEDPIDVAIREAKEEANLTVLPEHMKKVMTYLSSPGGMSEAIHIYAASINSENIGGIHGLDSEDEDILVHVITREKALSMLSDGKITNAATIIGLQWLAMNYQTIT